MVSKKEILKAVKNCKTKEEKIYKGLTFLASCYCIRTYDGMYDLFANVWHIRPKSPCSVDVQKTFFEYFLRSKQIEVE